MTDPIATTSTAPNNPTSPGPVQRMQSEPTRHDGSPRPGVISDAAYDALDAAAREKFARVKQGPQGGSEWRERSTLPSETGTDPAKPGTTTTPGDATVTADGRLQVGEMLLSQEDIKTLVAEKA
jgi:hypothetical protein